MLRKEEIDIYDIPIAQITKQYLGYVDLMKELDLEVAGEFILMAATLIQIKVRMLLPRPEMEGDEELEDPRAELVRQLLEYKRFKEVAENISDLEDRARRLYPRHDFEWTKPYRVAEEISNEELLKDVSMFDLLRAFKFVLDNMPKITTHEVGETGVSIEEQIDYILTAIEIDERISFFDVISRLKYRVEIVVTFMAILELIKAHKICFQQAEIFGDIYILKYSESVG
ncbi:segregation/condensation protein A [bacterium]|nr:segregation/condensation protein A [bacterium]